MVRASTHLMFQGGANDALALYASVFPEFRIETIERHDGNGGTVRMAHVSFAGHRLVVIDSPIPHAFDFTPSVSLFVDFDTVDAMGRAFDALGHDGEVLMPVGAYGFSERFGWITDRFGVSWQLNVPGDGVDLPVADPS